MGIFENILIFKECLVINGMDSSRPFQFTHKSKIPKTFFMYYLVQNFFTKYIFIDYISIIIDFADSFFAYLL